MRNRFAGANRISRGRWALAGAFVATSLALFALNPYCPPASDAVPGASGGGSSCAIPSTCPCTNSPVYVQTGTPSFAETDLVAGGPGLSLALRREYLGSSRFVGMLGIGWITPFEEHLSEETDGTNCRAVLRMKDGRTTYFDESPCGSNSYVNGEAYPWSLIYDDPVAGKWTLYREDGSSEVFDQWGALEALYDADGNSLQASYGVGHELIEVIDPRRPGRAFQLNYDANGFVSSVVYQSGGMVRQVTYGRDPSTGDLNAITTPDGWTEVITYRPNALGVCQAPHLMEAIHREKDGTAFPPVEANTYYDDYRLSQQTEQGRAVAYDYPKNTDYTALESVTRKTWVDARGVTEVKLLYADALGRITKIERYDNGSLKTTELKQYDAASHVIYSKDANGLWTHTQYDAWGNVTAITRAYCNGTPTYPCNGSPTNVTWTYGYTTINGIPRITEIVGPPGYAHTKMDLYATTDSGAEGGIAGKLHFLKRVNDDATEDIQATYTYVTDAVSPAFGQVKRITNGAGAMTVYGYDSNGALESLALPDSNQTGLAVTYLADPLYQVTQVTDQAAAVTAILYDGAGRTQQLQPPDPSTGQPSAAYATAYGYDAVDASGTYSPDPLVKATVTDPNGRVTERYADADGHIIAVKDAAGNVTRYAYYPGGLLQSITDANGNVTTYAYDGFDRLASVTDPYGKVTSYSYYADGKLQTRTDGRGQTITYAYDNLGRLTAKTYGALGSVSFAYNGDRISTVTDTYHPQIGGQTQSYTYGYDVRHRLQSVTSPTGTVTYGYASDTDDQVATVSDGTQTWTYAYYPDGSLHTIAAPEGTYTYTYNRVGQVADVAYPNGSSAAYAYDLQHRLTQIQNLASGSSLISQYDYAYDGGTGNKGMITAVTERFRSTDQVLYGPYTTSYGYDALYQLTQAVYPAYDAALSVPWSNQTHAWAYDAIGNRLTQTKTTSGGPVLDVATYAYTLSNHGPQLAGVTHTDGEPAASFSYDANGNTTTRIEGGVTTTYTWDMDDKMAGLGTSDSSQSETNLYAYNGDRLSRTLNGTVWSYLFSKEDILRVDQPGGPVYLTQGPGIDDVLAETQIGTTTYAYKNMLSSVTGLTDASGLVTRAYTYDAWGQAGGWPDPTIDGNLYGYTGREWENPDSYYYRNRFFDQVNGRMLSKDLVMFERYVYAHNSPIKLFDPSGWIDTMPSHGKTNCHQIGSPQSGPWHLVQRLLQNHTRSWMGVSFGPRMLTFFCNWEDTYTWWEKWEQTIRTLIECDEDCNKSVLFFLVGHNEKNESPTETHRVTTGPWMSPNGNKDYLSWLCQTNEMYSPGGFLFVPPGGGEGGGSRAAQ